MIASVLYLGPGDIKRAEISDAYSIHKVIYSLFPGSKRTFLYYDQGGDNRSRKILIVSKHQPEDPEYGTLESKAVPTNFLQQDHYAFHIRLNPVKSESQSRKRIAIIGEDALREWFVDRSPEWGFHTAMKALEITATGVQSIERAQRKIVHNVAEFRGLLSVSDRETFIRSFESGIGKAKAFGFGLLQIRPIKNHSRGVE